MIIRGDTNIIKVYDLTPVIDMENYDLDSEKDREKLKDSIMSYLDNQELEAINMPNALRGVIPEGMEIQIGDEIFTFEDVDYENFKVDEIISENFEENQTLLLLQANGEGYFEYENDYPKEELKFGYIACDIENPDEPIYDFFCDLILPDEIKRGEEKLEVVATNFYPKDTIVAEAYVVRKNEEGKYLEKICDIDVLHFGWDDFEDIIQVDYNETTD